MTSIGDPLSALARMDGVCGATAEARDAIDAVLWRRDVRAAAAAVAAASVERGGRDSAAIDGADVVVVDDSPMGRVLDAAMRVTAAVPAHVDVFANAPLQALAALHVIVATEFADADDLGRPRSTDVADDPLRLGQPAPATELSDRLMGLAALLTGPTEAPALVVAAVAHAELASLRPFTWGSGLLARATVRLVLASRGVDPSLFTVPERGLLELGRPVYVRALRAYMSGEPAGVASWLIWHANALTIGAHAVVVP